MARKIKFALEMADGTKVRGSLEELREHFDLESVAGYFLSGKLVEWLDDRYYEDEADALRNLDKDTPDFNKKLCDILGVESEGAGDLDPEQLERLNEKKAILRQKTSDENIISNAAQTAFNQEDLADLLDIGTSVIYLCGEKFNIPARVGDKKYIGILGTPKVAIKANAEELEAKGIVFENVVLPWGKKEESPEITESTPDCFYPRSDIYNEVSEVNNLKKEEYREKISVPIIPIEQLKEIFAGVFETFQEEYGNDVWDVIHLKNEEHCYEDFNASKKTIALNLVCKSKYTEDDLVFIRVTTDFKAGWAFTKDSFCCGGSIGSGIIPYSEIDSVRQYLGAPDSNGIWITPKHEIEGIKFERSKKGFLSTPQNQPEYRVWCGKGSCGNGDEVLTGFDDGDDMERIVAFLDVVKSLF